MKHKKWDVSLGNWDLKIREKIEDFHLLIESELSNLKLESLVKQGIEEVLDLAVKDKDVTHASFPFEWGDSDGMRNPQPDDPLTVYVVIDLANDESEQQPIFEFSLSKFLLHSIELHADHNGKVSDSEGQRILSQMRDALIELANKIDKSIN